MSDGHIEDVVERTVAYLVDESKSPRLRDWLWNLYLYEEQFDTSFTAFRQMPILLKAGLWHRFETEKTPQYQAQPEVFKSKDGVFTDNGEGFFKPPYLYAQIGSSVWSSWVAHGMLKSKDIQSPIDLHIVEVAAEVAELEAKKAQQVLTHWWFALIANDYFEIEVVGPKRRIAELKKLPAAEKFLQYARAVQAAEHFEQNQIEWPYSELDFNVNDIDGSSFLRWWFGRKKPVTSKLSPVKAFKALDSGKRLTSKNQISQRHEKGQQIVAELIQSKSSNEEWISVLTQAVNFREWGPFATLYGLRFLNSSFNDHIKQVNQEIVTDSFLIGLMRASQARYSKQRQWPREMLAFKPGKDGAVAAYTDECGLAAVDYCLESLRKMPWRVLYRRMSTVFVGQMIPDCKSHPYFELELIRQLKPTKSKRALVGKVTVAIKTAARGNDWLDTKHLAAVKRSISKSIKPVARL